VHIVLSFAKFPYFRYSVNSRRRAMRLKTTVFFFVTALFCAAQDQQEHFKSVHGNPYVSDEKAKAGADLTLKNPDMRDLLKGSPRQYHFIADAPPEHSFSGDQFPAHAIKPGHWWSIRGRHTIIASYNIDLATKTVRPADPITYTTK
jgi:hypothetical protein